MSLVLRCPTCQRRYQPGGSLEAGDLNTRCPHCARREARRELKKPVYNVPADRGSRMVWVAAAVAGASLLLIAIVLGIGYAVTHANAPSSEPASRGKAPARATSKGDPIRIPAPPPTTEPAPRGPDRTNDNDWDR